MKMSLEESTPQIPAPEAGFPYEIDPAPPLAPPVAQPLAPDLAPDVAPPPAPDVAPDVAPVVAPDVTPDVASDVAPAVLTPDPAPVPAPPAPVSELDKYWAAVRENPGDFTGWTYLLQFVEQESGLNDARPAFEDFLAKYPYCYGYWKKYADLEKKHQNLEECEQVFEKGLQSISLSIDLWVHYITFAQEKYNSDLDKEQKIRNLYERAMAAAGLDFRSDKLWDMYISWEQENKNLKNVTSLYDRILATPTQMYAHHFESFSKHVQNNHPRDILTLDEFLKVRKLIVKTTTKKDVIDDIEEPDTAVMTDASLPQMDVAQTEAPLGNSVAMTTELPPVDLTPAVEPPSTLPPGESAPIEPVPIPDIPKEDDAPPGLESSGAEDEAEIQAIKNHVIEIRQSIHKLNEQEVSRRWAFEEGIRRPYFHVKPLEKVQIKNWRDYLDFEVEFGTHDRTVILFERCLIACALYEEFWMKYTKYMDKHSAEAVRNIYARACGIYLKKKPSIHLAWASFEERQGNVEVAQQILARLEQEVPKLAMVHLRQISVERRHGHFNKVEEFYRKYMEQADDKSKSFYAIKYARYQAKVLRNVAAARQTLDAALEVEKDNMKLYLQLIDLEYQQPDMDEGRLQDLFQKAVDSPLALEHRIAFSQRRTEFMEDFSSNIAKVQEAYENHQKLLKELNAQGAKKRKAQETAEETQGEKKAKTDNGTVSNGDSSQYSTQSAQSQYGMDYSTQQQQYYGQWGNQGYNNAHYNYNPWGPYSNSYY